MIALMLTTGRGLLPPRKAKHGVGSCWSESLKYPAVKKTPRPLNYIKFDIKNEPLTNKEGNYGQ
jgi:hypothetical protein